MNLHHLNNHETPTIADPTAALPATAPIVGRAVAPPVAIAVHQAAVPQYIKVDAAEITSALTIEVKTVNTL